MMLEAIARLDQNIVALSVIPGSKTLREKGSQLSLKDIKYRITDLKDIYLKPLTNLIYQAGIYREKNLSVGYIHNRLFELNLQKAEAASKKKVYEDSLEKYVLKGGDTATENTSSLRTSSLLAESSAGIPAMIPQFGADFLNNLIELGQERSDANFRQEIIGQGMVAGIQEVETENKMKYYEGMLNEISRETGGQGESIKNKDFAKQTAKTVLEMAYNELLNSIKQINNIYQDLFERYLQPDCMLYTILEPVINKTDRPLNVQRIFMFLVLAWFLLEGMLLAAVLIFTPASRPGGRNLVPYSEPI